MTKTNQPEGIPIHLGIIPDGNRRWATSQSLPTLEGHRRGMDVAKELAIASFDRGVTYFTMFAFSTENWTRTKSEVGYLMDLFYRLVTKEFDELESRHVRLRVLGRRDRIPKRLRLAIEQVEERTKDNQAGTLALCIDYGGEQELADAASSLAAAGVAPDEITPELLSGHLYSPDIPPIDLVIRTSGEHRTSGFMLWRTAYAEYYFTEINWPAFTTADLDAALADFAQRTRRFGR